MAELLQISETTVYDIINRNHLETIVVDYWKRIPKEVFERWYYSQTRYRTQEDRERDAKVEQDTVSMPEIAWLLGIHRKEVYSFIYAKENEGRFRFAMVADRKRITRDSFMRWLNNQEKYHILTTVEREKLELERAAAEEKLRPKEPKNPNYYTVEEITYFFDIHRSTVYKWIKEPLPPAASVRPGEFRERNSMTGLIFGTAEGRNKIWHQLYSAATVTVWCTSTPTRKASVNRNGKPIRRRPTQNVARRKSNIKRIREHLRFPSAGPCMIFWRNM